MANPTTPLVGACLAAFDGTTWDRVTNGGGVEATALRVTVANDSTGLISVDDNAGSLTVDGTVTANAGTGTFTTSDTATLVDDAGFSAGSSRVMTIGAILDDVGPDTIDEEDIGAVRMSANRNLYVRIRDNAGNERGLNIDASGRALVDASGVAVPVTDNAGSLTVDNAQLSVVGSGTEAAAMRVTIATDSTGVLSVDDNGGLLTVDGTVSVNLNAGTNTNEVVGDAAHDAAAAGNPVAIGGISQDMDDTAPPNQVSAEGEATRLACDRDGALFVRPFGPRIWSYHENSSSALTDAEVHAAPAAGLSLYVGTIIVSTGAATAMNIFLEEGASTVLGPWYLEAVSGRGLALQFNPPKKITAATALTITTSAAIAHSIDITGHTAAG